MDPALAQPLHSCIGPGPGPASSWRDLRLGQAVTALYDPTAYCLKFYFENLLLNLFQMATASFKRYKLVPVNDNEAINKSDHIVEIQNDMDNTETNEKITESDPEMANDDVIILLKSHLKGKTLKKSLEVWNLSLRHSVSVSSINPGMVQYNAPFQQGYLTLYCS